MTALAANIDATQTLIPVDVGLTNGSFQLPLYYTVGSEAVRVTGRAHRTTWLVERGIAGTTAASHSSAATLTRYYPEGATGAGAGGVTVDNQSDPPAEIATIIALGAVIAGDEATLGKWTATSAASGDIDYSTTVTASHENGVAIVNRNAIGIGGANSEANTTATAVDGDAEADTTVTVAGAEDANARTIATTASGAADVSRSATATDPDGSANANTNATAAGATGNAQANTSVSVGGDGNADLLLAATVEGTGMAVVSVMSSRGAAEAGMRTETDATSARLGFNGTAPIAKPTGVAVTAEAIHAALVSLGLIAA